MARDTETLPRRYARAFLSTLIETGREKAAESVTQQLESISELGVGEVGDFFVNPVFGKDEKEKVLKEILKKFSLDEDVKRFVTLLVSLGHVQDFAEIATAFKQANSDRRNEVQAKLRTAFPMDESEKLIITKELSRVTGKEVTAEVVLDKNLIGGVIAEVGDQIFDASIRGYLNRLQEEL